MRAECDHGLGGDEGARGLRAQPGPRARHGLAGHDRLGFNYRLTDLASALGLVQLERLDGMLADQARVASWYREALSGVEGLELPCEDFGGDVRGWFVFVVQLPRGVDR